MLIDGMLVDITWHVGRYWSEVLCCIITTHLGGLEVKVTDLEILCFSFMVNFFICLYLRYVDGSS